jgi:hypothetical protein
VPSRKADQKGDTMNGDNPSTSLPILALLLVVSLLAACGQAESSPPAAAPTAVTQIAYNAMPDPRTDPAKALRYTDFPASLGSVGFTSTFRLTADPEKNWGYEIETARSFGTIEVVDYAAGTIDIELHVNFTVSGGGQDMHVIRFGDRAWARGYGGQWGERPVEELTSDDWERMLWGGWHPLNALEPFDSATEVEWVEDSPLDGEPAHHLRVVFDPEKMRHLAATAKARYEYYWVPLLHEAGGMYGVPASVDVQADVWLAAEDLAVRQIDMLIQIVTQEDESGAEKTDWAITRTVQFDAEAPNAIAEPVLDAASADETDCSKVTEISEAECRALVALYEGTGGEAWQAQAVDGWLVGNQPCTWGGVTCRGGHVRWLILGMAGLSGTLPPEVGDLQWLQVLGLTYNDLTGPLPPELGALGGLQALDLSRNWKLGGPIPDEIGNLHSLQEINFSGSALTGPLPEGFKDMQLTYMYIGAGLCVPDDPDWRDWVESIAYLGMYSVYDEVESIYCTQ